jgi:uncharacterized protein (TIGR03435 family)
MRRAALVLTLLAAGAAAAAQSPADSSATAFEVASIKSRVGERAIVGGRRSPDRFDRIDITLLNLIIYAFDMRTYQVEGGPDWVSSARFDVSAKAPGPVTPAELRPMVRRLLEERFALETHTETRELPIYELVMARRDGRLGPNIVPALVDCEPFLTGQRPMEESPREEASGLNLPRCASGASFGGGLITPFLNGQSLAALARYLEPTVGRSVVDKTGVAGLFDIELTYLDERMLLPGAPAPEGPALFTALEEQLGLKLESSRGPVEVLVIDSVSMPTPD